MNSKLIFGLSLFGLAMAFATVYFISSSVEPFCWLAVFIISAIQVAKHAMRKYFLHGFLISILNCIWMTWVHISMLTIYLAHHSKEAAYYAKLNREIGMTPIMTMIVMAPFIALFSGLILGLFSTIAKGLYDD